MSAAASPPRLARALLRHAVPDEARDAVDGDLHELYGGRHAAKGVAASPCSRRRRCGRSRRRQTLRSHRVLVTAR